MRQGTCWLTESGHDVSPRKVIAFEQQRLTSLFGQRIGEAITKIEAGRMAASPAKAAVGIGSESLLIFGKGNYFHIVVFHQLNHILFGAVDSGALRYNSSFQQRGS